MTEASVENGLQMVGAAGALNRPAKDEALACPDLPALIRWQQACDHRFWPMANRS